MKKELLEYLVRECVREVIALKEADGEDPTIGAPAPPAGGQGTADQPAIPQAQSEPPQAPPTSTDIKGLWYVDPKRPQKPSKLQVSQAQDAAKLERELYRTAAKSAGPRVKVSSAALRDVPRILANPNAAMFLYVGKRNPDDADDDLYLLPAQTFQQAQQASVAPGVSAEHPTIAIPEKPPGFDQAQTGPAVAQASNTMAPDIDEAKDMLSTMIREALMEARKR